MREARAGTLLFTTGGGSVHPVPMLGNVNAAGAALRNWVINLHNELADSGVYAAHVAINVWIGEGGPEGFPTATPERIAPLYWDLHDNRSRPRPSSPADRRPVTRGRGERPSPQPLTLPWVRPERQ
jgi:hypothetical protein